MLFHRLSTRRRVSEHAWSWSRRMMRCDGAFCVRKLGRFFIFCKSFRFRGSGTCAEARNETKLSPVCACSFLSSSRRCWNLGLDEHSLPLVCTKISNGEPGCLRLMGFGMRVVETTRVPSRDGPNGLGEFVLTILNSNSARDRTRRRPNTSWLQPLCINLHTALDGFVARTAAASGPHQI